MHAKRRASTARLTTCFIALLFVAFATFFPSYKVHAAVSQEISFQGKIVNKTNGTNIYPSCVIDGAANDRCDIRVGIYANSSGGTALWSEIHTDVEIGQYMGVFNINIGSYCITTQGGSWTTDGDAGGSRCTVSGGGAPWGVDDTLYIQIEFDTANTVGENSFSSPETFGRKLLTAVPFALHAETVGGLESSNLVQVAPNSVQTTSDTYSLINLETTANTSNPLLRLVENGAGTPNFINLIQGSTSQFIVSNSGDIQVIAGAQIQSLTNAVQGLQIANASGSPFVNFDTQNQRVGIGTTTSPVSALDVGGTAKIGGFNEATAGTCNGIIEGAMYYDTDDDEYKYCNGTIWTSLSPALNVATRTKQIRTVLCTKTFVSAGVFDTNTDCGGLSSSYTHLEINVKARANGTAGDPDNVMMYFNNDTTTSNYRSTTAYGRDSALNAWEGDDAYIGSLADGNAPANAFSFTSINIPNYSGGLLKTAISHSAAQQNSGSDEPAVYAYYWENTAAVTRILIRAGFAPTNQFVANSYVEVIGIREETIVTGISVGDNNGDPISVSTALDWPGLEVIYTSSGTTADGIKVTNSSSGVITDGLDVSDQEILNALNLGSNNIVMDNDGTVNWNDSAGNNLIEIKDLSTNFGATVEAGAFISRNSYFGDEFVRERGNLTNDAALNWGDDQAWTVDEQLTVTNDCQWSTVNDNINGITRMETVSVALSTACALYSGSAVGNPHTTQFAANLPLVIMKIRPSNTAASVWAGLSSVGAADSSDPTNGIWFSTGGGTAWTGVTASSGTPTSVTCTGQSISTSNFALLKIEVRSANEVRFYVDNDTSDGINWVYCGASTTNIPSAGLAQYMKINSSTVGHSLDIDFYRNWSDDNAATPEPIDEPEVETPANNNNTVTTPRVDNEPQAQPLSYPISAPISLPVSSPANTPSRNALVNLEGESIVIKYLTVEQISLESSITVNVGDLLTYGKIEVGGDLLTKGDFKVDGTLAAAADVIGSVLINKLTNEYKVDYNQQLPSLPNIFMFFEDSEITYEIIEQTVSGFRFKVNLPVELNEQDVRMNWLVINQLK